MSSILYVSPSPSNHTLHPHYVTNPIASLYEHAITTTLTSYSYLTDIGEGWVAVMIPI